MAFGAKGKCGARAALVGISILVSFIVGELAARVFFASDPAMARRKMDKGEGPRFSKNWFLKSERLRIGNYGRKHANELRIAMLGDSFVEGTQDNVEDTYFYNFSAVLGAQPRGGRLNIINGGYGGVGPSIHWNIYTALESFKPDLVVVHIFANDFSDEARFRVHGMLDYDAEGLPIAKPLTLMKRSWFRQLARKSVLLCKVADLLGLSKYTHWREQMDIEEQVARSTGYFATGTAVSKDDYKELVDPIHELLMAWRTRCLSRGQEFYVVLIPPAEQVSIRTESGTRRVAVLAPGGPMASLALRLGASNVRVLSLVQAFRNHVQVGMPLYGYDVGDIHWTARGSKLAAEVVGEWLVGLSPRLRAAVTADP